MKISLIHCLLSSACIAPAAELQSVIEGKSPGDPVRLERIKDAAMPTLSAPVLFNTEAADAVLGALEIFPPDNAWNQMITDWPLHEDSPHIVASIGKDKPLRYNQDMAFVLVPADQKRIEVKIGKYADESDAGPFPVPDNVPVEGWPAFYHRDSKLRTAKLDDVQRDSFKLGGDRHAIVVDPTSHMLFEFYQLRKADDGWHAAQASVFDLKANPARPVGWTSTDAAGLAIFPSIVRHDELKRGRIDHALRFTVKRSRKAFVAPATHYASPHLDPELPRMGERFRLRVDFDVSDFSPEVKTILTALKRYGMIAADNGLEWSVSVAPDERIPLLHKELRRVQGADFDVVVAPPSR